MKNVNCISLILLTLCFIRFNAPLMAQDRAQNGVKLKQGNYTTASENPNDLFGHCACGTAQYDCICGVIDYHDMNADVLPGQIVVGVASQTLYGTTLLIKFSEKLNMDLKSNNFEQKEKVAIKSDIAHSLGFKSVSILPGKYSIKDDNSLALQVETSEPIKTRGWGWAAVIVIVVIVWGVLGGTVPSSGSNGGVPTAQGCDFCRLLPAYWSGLSWSKKIWMFAWYVWKRADCLAKGC